MTCKKTDAENSRTGDDNESYGRPLIHHPIRPMQSSFKRFLSLELSSDQSEQSSLDPLDFSLNFHRRRSRRIYPNGRPAELARRVHSIKGEELFTWPCRSRWSSKSRANLVRAQRSSSNGGTLLLLLLLLLLPLALWKREKPADSEEANSN